MFQIKKVRDVCMYVSIQILLVFWDVVSDNLGWIIENQISGISEITKGCL